MPHRTPLDPTMKILVPLKIFADYDPFLALLPDGRCLDPGRARWIVNPFDEVAVEEAVRMKERGEASGVTVASVGPDEALVQVRHALAMGADAAICVRHAEPLDADVVSRILAHLYRLDDYGLVILGRQAADSDAGQTGQLLAAHLGLPQACFVSRVRVWENAIRVTRELDEGRETVELPVPCVVTADPKLNEPRFAKLGGHMRAKTKPLTRMAAEDLGIDLRPKVETTGVVRQMGRPRRGRLLGGVEELADALAGAAKAT